MVRDISEVVKISDLFEDEIPRIGEDAGELMYFDPVSPNMSSGVRQEGAKAGYDHQIQWSICCDSMRQGPGQLVLRKLPSYGDSLTVMMSARTGCCIVAAAWPAGLSSCEAIDISDGSSGAVCYRPGNVSC